MHPTQVREPFHRPGWIYEAKVDGWRILAYKDGTSARLLSRNGIDHARRFRENPSLEILERLARALGVPVGELLS